MSLVDDINTYVQTSLDGYSSPFVRDKKIIHDPIHGTSIFERHEIALLDSPLCQRLRGIAQNGPASLVYPSANATRLEHSLGVCAMAGRILEALRVRHPNLVTAESVAEVRIATLLHDVSHGPFSHLTEEIIRDFSEVEFCVQQHPGKFKAEKPSEMINYLMLVCPAFREFLINIIKTYEIPLNSGSIDRIAEMITGVTTDPLYDYKMSIVNGPYDADKLDYLQRDAYFAGFRTALDLDRLLHNIWIDDFRLRVMTGGVVTLEQILFNKIQAFSRIYHHHKVRAAECVIKGILEIIRDNSYSIAGRSMKRAVDFLWVTDKDILYLHDKPVELRKYTERYMRRNLFKRALVISHDTVNDPQNSPGYHDFTALAEDRYVHTKELRSLIVEALGGRCSIYEIWVDLPKSPHSVDSAQAIIQDPGGPPRKLAEFFPSDMSLTTYESGKWKGHIFCPPDPDIRREVNKKAIEIISDIYNISFNQRATEWAKIP